MEGAASIERDGARALLDNDEVGGAGRSCPPYDRRGRSLTEPKKAIVADVVEEVRGEFILMLGSGDHSCERWQLTESLARRIRRELNRRLD